MERVFVTGGSGFIGSHLVQALLSRGHEVTSFDRAPTTLHPGARCIVGDIRDISQLKQSMQGHTVVYHLAAMVGVVECIRQEREVVDCNYIGVKNILEASREAGISRLVCASSSEVYGEGRGRGRLRESDAPAPLSIYGKSKAWSEELLRAEVSPRNEQVTILRYCNIYGPRQRPVFVVPLFITRALRGEPLLLCDGGAQLRNYTYVDDAVRGTIAAMEHGVPGCETYNICSEFPLSVRELADKVIGLNGGAGDCRSVSCEELGRRQDYEIETRMPAGDKARTGLQFTAEIQVDEGLARTMEYYRQQHATEQ